ncbi:MAG: hypothetical protein QM673_16950 [Gordonia sp. (in: high G+C Gram-positive bacteria)]
MYIEIDDHARQHGITDPEIRSVMEYPLVSYHINSRSVSRDAELYRYIGDPSVVIEVVAEDLGDDTYIAFHAMTLRTSVALEAFENSGGTVDLRDEVTPQRR